MTNPPLPPTVSDAISSGDLQKILAAAIEHFGCQAGSIHLLQDGVLQLAAHHGLPPQVTAIVEKVPIGKGIAGLAAERREPITICNLQTDTSGQARPGARATGMEGSIAVPMFSGGGTELAGVLGIAKSDAHDWTDDEKALLQTVANQVRG